MDRLTNHQVQVIHLLKSDAENELQRLDVDLLQHTGFENFVYTLVQNELRQ